MRHIFFKISRHETKNWFQAQLLTWRCPRGIPKSAAATILAYAALLMHCSTKRMPGTSASPVSTSDTAGCGAADLRAAMLCTLSFWRAGMADGGCWFEVKLVSQAAAHAVLVCSCCRGCEPLYIICKCHKSLVRNMLALYITQDSSDFADRTCAYSYIF